MEQLRRPPGGAGADDRALRQRGDGRGAEQHVALVGARQDRGDDQLGRADRLDVLQRVYGGIDLAGGEPLVELAGPQRLAADFGQGPILNLVPTGENRGQFDRFLAPAVRRAEPRARLFRLRHSERRAARAEPESNGVCHRVRLP